MSFRRCLLICVVAGVVLLTGCAAPAAPPSAPAAEPTQPPAAAPTEAPTEVPTEVPTEAPTRAPTATSYKTFNVGSLFPEGPGRELVLSACTACHNIAPLVTQRKTQEEWDRTNRDHNSTNLSGSLSEEDNALVFEYLATYYDENAPVPELPQILIDAWTSY